MWAPTINRTILSSFSHCFYSTNSLSKILSLSGELSENSRRLSKAEESLSKEKDRAAALAAELEAMKKEKEEFLNSDEFGQLVGNQAAPFFDRGFLKGLKFLRRHPFPEEEDAAQLELVFNELVREMDVESAGKITSGSSLPTPRVPEKPASSEQLKVNMGDSAPDPTPLKPAAPELGMTEEVKELEPELTAVAEEEEKEQELAVAGGEPLQTEGPEGRELQEDLAG